MARASRQSRGPWASSVEQIEAAAKGPLDPKAFERIAAVQRSFAGEPR
jgi:hypothetical protein